VLGLAANFIRASSLAQRSSASAAGWESFPPLSTSLAGPFSLGAVLYAGGGKLTVLGDWGRGSVGSEGLVVEEAMSGGGGGGFCGGDGGGGGGGAGGGGGSEGTHVRSGLNNLRGSLFRERKDFLFGTLSEIALLSFLSLLISLFASYLSLFVSFSSFLFLSLLRFDVSGFLCFVSWV